MAASGTTGLQKQRYPSHLILNPCLVKLDLIMCLTLDTVVPCKENLRESKEQEQDGETQRQNKMEETIN